MHDLLVVNMSESPIYSADVAWFTIVKMDLLLYDLNMKINMIYRWWGND